MDAARRRRASFPGPRINPAVIVCVRDPKREKIVLTRYARGRYMPIDALVAELLYKNHLNEQEIATILNGGRSGANG